ncbi:FAD-dependent oxidoreductase [Pontiella sulfatireligans]|uniref:tRNA uridine 5-carboxymethylaminomethyl modification enzyme MnmG n=1 Tax=Pontiella sulfatireligans TaxID=2750658 RepID=A0A6C2UG38_9BACT|nr:FAD-dependent oxidoreductase [Pontiella sulfatireligans]VGO18176.1 hypothetical protein SCARR_00227 [Pontiella sulfatireligans]
MKKWLMTFVGAGMAVSVHAAGLLIEAESFGAKDGWVIDQQSFEKMGSAYLMANGMGRTIPDTTKTVEFPMPGKYHALVRTYNWTAPWYDGKGPGKIQLLVDGQPLPKVVGETGKQWEWQYAGQVTVGKTVGIGLRDLTGFNGRVDAIYFCNDRIYPPNDPKKLNNFRRELLGFHEPEVMPKSDLVVVGGGVAGCTTALSAARLGLKVTLIQNRPVLGGNNSPEVHVKICGLLNKNRYPKIGNIVREITGIAIPEDSHKEYNVEFPHGGFLSKEGQDEATADLRTQIMNEEKNVSLHLNMHAFDVQMKDGKIAAVVARSTETGKEVVFPGTLFADCTGDGTLGWLAGADWTQTREGKEYANEPSAPAEADNTLLGMSVRWRSDKVGNPKPFPTSEEIPWAHPCSEEYHMTDMGGRWFWETGMNMDCAIDAEIVRDNGLRGIYGNWAYVHNNLDQFKNREITWLSHIGGKRESRRLLGDLILTENDIINQVEYPDASFTSTWSLDLHYATPENKQRYPGWEWQTYCIQDPIKPYHVPYRTLYSRNVDNLFMAGRNISVTHAALGTVRVMVTTGMMGEVVGMAAATAIENGTSPRGVYEKHLDQLIKRMEAGVPTKPNAMQKEPPKYKPKVAAAGVH